MSEVDNNTGAAQAAAAPEKDVKKVASTDIKASVKKATPKATPKVEEKPKDETEMVASAVDTPANPDKTVFKNSDKDGEKRAGEIADQMQIETVWENYKGEFFTSENLALNSVPTRKHLRKHEF